MNTLSDSPNSIPINSRNIKKKVPKNIDADIKILIVEDNMYSAYALTSILQ